VTGTGPPAEAERHLTVTDLSERLGVPVMTIYHWNCDGSGPSYLKIGRHVRYRLSDVEAWEQTRIVDRAGLLS
jgi:excisionase family DNA binding protein